jgi:NAD(P)-dependent dehydrogenase (short-subunit alcohol dehydrogenase family)
MQDRLKVVVTGGTGALGQAISQAFLQQGAKIFSSYIDDRELERLPDALKTDDFVCEKVDLTNESAVQAWIQGIGSFRVLVNVAGGFAMGSVEETSLSDWHHQLRMNLDTCFLTSREAVKVFKNEAYGRIINIAALAAQNRFGGMTAYKVSKAGVIHLTESLAEETLTTNITVNAILPAIMDTPANREAMPEADFSAWAPLESVASCIAYLAQPDSWPITGALIPLRGKC